MIIAMGKTTYFLKNTQSVLLYNVITLVLTVHRYETKNFRMMNQKIISQDSALNIEQWLNTVKMLYILHFSIV